MKKLLTLSTFALSVTLFISSCKDEDNGPDKQQEFKDSIANATDLAIKNYSKIVYASYEDSYTTALALQTEINAFVATPTEAGLEKCKTAWLTARNPYLQTEAYRFYGGPIDDENGPEGLLNAWPIDESFIDYVQVSAESDEVDGGIINLTEAYPTLDIQLIESLNEHGGETNISTGYHAIEFLLWGQDFYADGPGERPYTDYVTNGENATANNQARRAQYLKLVTELLVDNLAYLKDAWKEGSAYRTNFELSANREETLGKIFSALGELSKGELGGERMAVAVADEDGLGQENEHSCFSDNTIADIRMDFQGIKNVYIGTYTRVDHSIISGPSFSSIVGKLNKTKDDAVLASLTETETNIYKIPAPFDQAILNDNSKAIILTAVASLSHLSDTFADASLSIGAKQ